MGGAQLNLHASYNSAHFCGHRTEPRIQFQSWLGLGIVSISRDRD